MISKRVKTPEGGGSFGGLAQYIAADKTDDNFDKLDHLWMVNCNAGEGIEDLKLGIIEIENTQEMNQRAEGSKTYHLIISFQSGESLPPEDLAKIERRYADALGFANHQRVVASHKNTGNYHIHVAYNMINPDTHNIHHPSWDYYARDKICRGIERDYGLKVDNGHEKWREWRNENPDQERTRKSQKARDMEAHRHEQSFTSIVQEQREEILADVAEAPDWTELHRVLDARGLTIKPRGAGLVIGDGEHHTKASNIGRDLSLKKLEERLGEYQNPDGKSPCALLEQITVDKPAILEELKTAQNWQDVHHVFSSRDYELRKRGRGLALYRGKEHEKASSLDRGVTLKNLEQQFGQFEREDSPLDQVMKAPEMLGSVLDGCENWKDVDETLNQFNLKLRTRGHGYIEAGYDQTSDLKDAGARYDSKVGHWYIPNDARLDDFKDFKRGYVLTDGKYHTFSDKLPGLNAERLNTKFGDRKAAGYAVLFDALETSQSWQDVHQRLHEHGYKFSRRKATAYREESFTFHDGNESISCKNIPHFSDIEKNPKLGEFEPSRIGKKEYQPRPLTKLKGKKQKDLWDQFLAKRRNVPSISWKEFLLIMAGVDPMAVALLNAGRKLLAAVHDVTRSRYTPKPRLSKEYDPLAGETHMPMYIQVSSRDTIEAKAAGAKWDPNMESWFVPQNKQSKKDLEAFKKWPVGLPASSQAISYEKARDVGMMDDEGMPLIPPPLKEYDPLADEKYLPMYIRVPFKEGNKAKAAGAKWDSNIKSWFIPQDKQSKKDREAFKKWPVGLPTNQQSLSQKKKARDMGVMVDDGMGLGDD